MSEFRRDPLTGDWSLLARERGARPRRVRVHEESIQDDDSTARGPCPLCPGNEGLSPPELARVAGDGGRWDARVFPNRYPALGLESDMVDLEGTRDWTAVPGFGIHEIIVDSPSHSTPFWRLPLIESVFALELSQRRMKDLRKDQRLRYFQLFKNFGAPAGGSQQHPHFQLVGMAFVPPIIEKILEQGRGRGCLVCRLLEHEAVRSGVDVPPRFLSESSAFVAVSDYAPRYSHQFSIYPKKHGRGFVDLSKTELEDFSQLVGHLIDRFERRLGEFPFNLVFVLEPVSDSLHWFVRIYPRLARYAGFELGTGIPVVSTAPEDSARDFREAA